MVVSCLADSMRKYAVATADSDTRISESRLRRLVKHTAPPRVLHWLRDVRYMLSDVFHAPEPLMPPVRLMHDGPRGRDMWKRGVDNGRFVYRELVQIPPGSDATILDIGCGIGRKTMALLEVLGPNGRYIGFDPVKRGIDWLNRNVHDERFHFLHADIRNPFYNAQGNIEPERFRLPAPDSSVDLVTAWSVFTHLTPDIAKLYLQEAARVLKPGGSLNASFFIMDKESLEGVKNGSSRRPMVQIEPNFYATNPSILEDATGFDHDWLMARMKECGLHPDRIVPGHWSRIGDLDHPRSKSFHSQDFVKAVKS